MQDACRSRRAADLDVDLAAEIITKPEWRRPLAGRRHSLFHLSSKCAAYHGTAHGAQCTAIGQDRAAYCADTGTDGSIPILG